MKLHLNHFIFSLLIFSCSTGNLEFITDLPSSLKETSAIEMVEGSDLFWVIEDSGNNNAIYGLNEKGEIVKDIDILNAANEDWEDLTSDTEGNIYIGDFGNNDNERVSFQIHRISKISEAPSTVKVKTTRFTLPKQMDSEDFESFFEYKGWFYIFSKNHKKTRLIKVPNKEGDFEATFISKFNLDGKHTKVTSADISKDGKMVVLLNHDKLWKLTDFSGDNFFSGTIKGFEFDHDSQKEGITLIDNYQVLISDELEKSQGGNIYKFKLN